jgi:hypothetical protein
MEAKATDLPELSAPARRALLGAGYTRLEHLTEVRESEVMRLHGMGPKAMRVLRDAPSGARPVLPRGMRRQTARATTRTSRGGNASPTRTLGRSHGCGLRSDGAQDFPPASLRPTLGRAGLGGTGGGRRVTAEVAARRFVHVMGDYGARWGWDGTCEVTAVRPVNRRHCLHRFESCPCHLGPDQQQCGRGPPSQVGFEG